MREAPSQVWSSSNGSECSGKYRQIAIRSRSRKQTSGLETLSARGARRSVRLWRSTSTRGPSTSKRQGRPQRLTRRPFLWMRRGSKDDVLADALFRLGTWIDSNGVDAPGPYRAARDLLLRRSPRLADGTDTLILPDESTVDAAKRIGTLLDCSVLADSGASGIREDIYRRTHDLRTGAAGKESGDYRDQPQGHPEPAP